MDQLYHLLDHTLADACERRTQTTAVEIAGPGDLYARDAELARLHKLIADLRAAEHRLCFGRIDATAATDSGSSLHIGRIGLRVPAGESALVDWRAEAARPFYAATPISPLGLRRRRHLRLDGRVVVGVSDEILDGSAPTPEDVIGDGPLVEALDQARTGRMHDAASTLQAEQDAIVRSPHTGVTIVEGGPGTGKTIVALHRAAYVLYAFPQIARQGVLVYGPNRRFLDYIGDVLPSLGENDVTLATAADLLGIAPRIAEPEATAVAKGRGDLAGALARWVSAQQPKRRSLTVTVDQDTLTLGPAAIDRARRLALQEGRGHNPAREVFKEHVVDDLVDMLERISLDVMDAIDADVAALGIDPDRAVAADLRTMGFDDLDPDADRREFDRESAYSDLIEDAAVEAAVEQLWPRLDAETVLHGLLAHPEAITDDMPTWSTDESALSSRGRSASLTCADLPILDEIRDLVDGPPEQTYGHIVVDEAQELTELEWRMLMRRCPARSMTIVGDLAQTGSTTTVRTWEDITQSLGVSVVKHTLSINYRTTAEILQTATPLLTRIAPGQQPSGSIRSGPVPTTTKTSLTNLDDVVRGLIETERVTHADELTGVICPSGLISSLTSRLEDMSAVIVAARESRGLEFDAVIVVDPAAIEAERPGGTRDLYVAITRATKRLTLVEVPHLDQS